MGRTYEALSGTRLRKAAGAESLRSLPFPSPPAELPQIVETESEVDSISLVPMTDEDLPSDDPSIPFIEVGEKKSTPETTDLGPTLRAPKHIPAFTNHEVGFQLLKEEAKPVNPKELPSKFVTYHQPNHPVSRQYRNLVDGILRQLPEQGCPVMSFIPTVPGTPTATTLINLAITRSTDGEGRILLVELVRGQNSSATILGVPHQPGLREVLTRTTPLTLAINRTAIDSLYVMPAGRVELGNEEFGRLGGLVDQLRARFDWILVEAPAWGTFPMRDWMTVSDGVYLITRPEEWDSPQTEFAHQGILDAGGKLRGCVTTKE